MALISRRASYGLRAMCQLVEQARAGRGSTIAALAEAETLPRKFLEQILRDLRQSGLVESRTGPGGGCWLARPAGRITVGDIVRALDGRVQPGHCGEPDEEGGAGECPGCWGPGHCAIHEVWDRLRGSVDAVLDDVTLEQLAARQREMHRPLAPDYSI